MPPLLPKVEGVCDKCGGHGTIVQRADDMPDVVANRLQIYKNETAPVLAHYEKKPGIVENFPVFARCFIHSLGCDASPVGPDHRSDKYIPCTKHGHSGYHQN